MFLLSSTADGFTIPRWGIMWGIGLALYSLVKLLSWLYRRRAPAPRWKHAAYLFAWVGMDVDAFLHTPVSEVPKPSTREWAFSLAKPVFGLAVLYELVPKLAEGNLFVLGPVAMIGLAFVLLFGFPHILSCFWRAVGVSAAPIMNWPILSQSLSEFWGRRWNLAFRDLTHRFIVRPLLSRLGMRGTLLLSFFVSGLLHDAVISVPAGAGYGGPTLYFMLQCGGIFIERAISRRSLGARAGWRRGLRGWLFCGLFTLGPSPLLFHEPFLRRLILPMLQAIGVQL